MFKDYNINILMNNINIIIKDFIKINNEFNEEQVRNLVTQVVLNQEHDENLYKQLVDKNFILFENIIYNKIINKINVKMFNKLIYPDEVSNLYNLNNYLKPNEKLVFSNVFKNLSKENFYVSRIYQIWNNYQNEINSENVPFIEKEFNGDFDEYLIFIIPRITKLNKIQLDKLLPDIDDDTISSNSIKEDLEDNNYDKEYIKILELNIDNLQIELQNIKDSIIPQINNLSKLLNDNSEELNNHKKQTKNSFEVIEERISKLINILNTTKL